MSKQAGVYEKFRVTRTDGTDAPGGKHHGCAYFVLDLDHDKHAVPALRAYGESCKDELPELSCDLLAVAGAVNPGDVLSFKIRAPLARDPLEELAKLLESPAMTTDEARRIEKARALCAEAIRRAK